MTLTSSTATSLVSDCDTVIDVNVQWNNASVYHASERADCFTSKSKVNAFDFKTDVSVTDAW